MVGIHVRGVALSLLLIGCVLAPTRNAWAQLPTTLDNFFIGGTQPDESGGVDFTPIVSPSNCANCHSLYDPVEIPIYSRWSASMMGQSARDPLFLAALTIANQDADFAGDLCIRCHAPGGWLEGRSVPTDGSALTSNDLHGVSCNFCHRMVDPVFKEGVSPPEDEAILAALDKAGLLPVNLGTGSFVVQATDVRRGPFDDVPENYHGVPIIASNFHTTSEICATCHDVSNPALVRQEDGSYLPNESGEFHPTGDQFDMFPVERTYSEWANSAYASMGVDSGGRFGGNHPTGVMRTCQDCHMPDAQSYGSAFDHEPFFERPDVPAHDFNGGSVWMLHVIENVYPGASLPWFFEDSRARATYMLENAATLEASVDACKLRVRVINETAHKLPTGYPEGRRMWIEVAFRDSALDELVRRGAYDDVSALLQVSDTRVYEAKLGLDAAMAALTGVPAGESFHFVLNNVWLKDNRIPPRGFTNAAFQAVQAAPVGAIYEDGQYWDDTEFAIPPGATSAIVRLYYQSASREYIEFLRDENRTDDRGDVMFEQWELTGKSPPVLMAEVSGVPVPASAAGDTDCDGDFDLLDYAILPECRTDGTDRVRLGCEALDFDLSGTVDLRDIAAMQQQFSPLD